MVVMAALAVVLLVVLMLRMRRKKQKKIPHEVDAQDRTPTYRGIVYSYLVAITKL